MVGRERELDVAAALDAERANDVERRAAQALMCLIGESLDRCDDDRVTRVDAERIDVLHRAHRDACVRGIAHDLVLDLLPAAQIALDDDLADRARAQPRANALEKLLLCLDDAAARTTKRERRTYDGGHADLVERRARRFLALSGRLTFDDH